MKAVIYNGPRAVSVGRVPDARIEKPTDALVRIATANICGSDLHMYEGRTSFEKGRVFGHENLGQVIEVGTGVDRLKLAEALGAIPIDLRTCDPVEEILGQTNGAGTDLGCECVGYQCCDRHGREANYYTMNSLVASTKATGGIGVVGVFVPKDPGASDDLGEQGKMAFDFGAFWFRASTSAPGRRT